ncbi:Lrp/AsnC ligand binding domain-containing protein [Novosphingobium sp. Gsoil 351]|uniref:Lrp/AsnC ligand binding domain-containing protein n=1 Tax=Novosphingobium sp. Gsoil 351 TaxID=2675225 RepID=UPI0012B4F006|nr:Lrp/AsnC ligand binding domain-containing protein [Novosphingobium sp. Gsoil 351]QGN54057.1 hypothetical protein GKE62_05395 [Novosphingobium sp. Gsoil 351]
MFAELKLKLHDEETLEVLEAQAREHPQIVECFSMSGQSDSSHADRRPLRRRL